MPARIIRNRDSQRTAILFLALIVKRHGGVLVVDGTIVKACRHARRVSFAPAAPDAVASVIDEKDREIVHSAVRNMKPGGLMGKACAELKSLRLSSMLAVGEFLDQKRRGNRGKWMEHKGVIAELTQTQVRVSVPNEKMRVVRTELFKS
jgi:hypothetical protein